MTKKAMVDVFQAGELPMLQVHDELAFSVRGEHHAREMKEIMESAIKIDVPVHCDLEMGPSWGECKDVA